MSIIIIQKAKFSTHTVIYEEPNCETVFQLSPSGSEIGNKWDFILAIQSNSIIRPTDITAAKDEPETERCTIWCRRETLAGELTWILGNNRVRCSWPFLCHFYTHPGRSGPYSRRFSQVEGSNARSSALSGLKTSTSTCSMKQHHESYKLWQRIWSWTSWSKNINLDLLNEATSVRSF